MRALLNVNKGWQFFKDTANVTVQDNAVAVDLPHSWNAVDGQDGGNDYFRGSCVYKKTIAKADLPQADEYYLEIRGANSSADAYVNGKHLAHHDGGYSTWRVNFTEVLADENEIAIVVDNSPNETVYPQFADFTFYGGLYRDVNIIAVAKTHFDLDYFGGTGIAVTPTVDGKNATVDVEVWVKDLGADDEIVYSVYEKDGGEVCRISSKDTKVSFTI